MRHGENASLGNTIGSLHQGKMPRGGGRGKTAGKTEPQYSIKKEVAEEKTTGVTGSLSSLKKLLAEQKMLRQIAALREKSFRKIGRFINWFVKRQKAMAVAEAEANPKTPREERKPQGVHFGETREPHQRRGPPLLGMTIRQNPLH